MPKEPNDMNRGELVAEVRKLRHILSRHIGGSDTLWMESGVNDQGKPFVHMHWGAESGQLSTGEAMQHALHMIETSVAAEHDGVTFKVLTEMGFESDKAAAFLVAMREARGQEPESSATH